MVFIHEGVFHIYRYTADWVEKFEELIEPESDSDEDEEIDEALIDEWAEKLAKQPPIALQMVKLAINTGSNTDIESGLIIESSSFNTAFSTEDGKEGLVAFTEKRKPNYKGK